MITHGILVFWFLSIFNKEASSTKQFFMALGTIDLAGMVVFSGYFSWQLYLRLRRRSSPGGSQRERPNAKQSGDKKELAVGYEIPHTPSAHGAVALHQLARHMLTGREYYHTTLPPLGFASELEEADAAWAIGATDVVVPTQTLSSAGLDDAATWLEEVECFKSAPTAVSSVSVVCPECPSAEPSPRFPGVMVGYLQCGGSITVPLYVPELSGDEETTDEVIDGDKDDYNPRKRERERQPFTPVRQEDDDRGYATIHTTSQFVADSMPSLRRRRVERPPSLASLAHPLSLSEQSVVPQHPARRTLRSSQHLSDSSAAQKQRRNKILQDFSASL